MQTFAAKGIIKELEADHKTVVISHEAISNYMPAMTMPFDVPDTNDLRGLSVGDAITFRMVVTPTHGWVEGITKVGSAPARSVTATPAAAESFHYARALPPLDEGDKLADYEFTNELGQAVRLSQFKGRVVAFTFFFTSCPFPDFCPRMTSNFSEVEKRLAVMTNAPGQWQLLSITFDPKNDTPKRLRTYAESAHYDPRHWSFLTGDEEQVGGLADQLGENFWHEGNSIGHNLRTVIVDSKGVIRKIFPGNKWTVDEFVEEMVAAGH